MKRALIFLLISAILFTCSLVTAFATPAPIEESALLYMATNRPIDEGYELLAASVIESDGEFTCVETVYKNTSIDVSLLSHEPPLARICIRHTWYRNKVRICCVELFPTFNYTGTTASVDRDDLERNFEQYEAGYPGRYCVQLAGFSSCSLFLCSPRPSRSVSSFLAASVNPSFGTAAGWRYKSDPATGARRSR